MRQQTDTRRTLRVGDAMLLMSGYLGRAASQMMLLAAFAHISGPAGAGEFVYAFAVSTPVMIAADLALRNVYQTLNEAPDFRVFFVVRAALTALASGGIALAALSGMLDVRVTILLPLLIMKSADAILDICNARLQFLGRNRTVALLIWLNTLLSVTVIATTYIGGLNPTWAVAGSAAASVVMALAIAPRLLAATRARWLPTRVDLKRVLRAGSQLGFSTALLSFLVYLPTLYIAHGADKATVGIFALCQYTVTFANLFFTSAIQSWVSDLRATYTEQGAAALTRHGRRVAAYLVSIGTIGATVTLLALKPILPWVFGPEFTITWSTSVPFAIAILVLSVEAALGTVLVVLNRYGARVATAVAGVSAGLAFAYLTRSHVTIVTGGYLVVVGVSARCLVSSVNLRRATRAEV